MRPTSSVPVLWLAAILCLFASACAAFGSGDTVTELRPGTMIAGSTTESEGSISVTHLWTVELTQKDAVFTFEERRVVLEGVVGSRPLRCLGNQSSGKRPDVVLELGSPGDARWKGNSINVYGRHYEISGPGTFKIDPSGTMTRV